MSAPRFPREWSDIKSIAGQVLRERTRNNAASWLDEEGGFGTGWSFRRNREAFEELAFEMHLLHDIKSPRTETTVLGQRLSAPIMIAPMSRMINVVCGAETFTLLARGAKMAGVAASAGHPATFQELTSMVAEGAPVFRTIKPLRDDAAFVAAVRDAERAGSFAIAMDIDAIAGLNGSGDEPRHGELNGPLSPSEVKARRKETHLPFVLKGIMSVRDAVTAVEVGADAIIVSNHGAHILDYCQPSIKVLPKIADAVGDAVEVWLDSGVRRGSDVLKALALGADAVLIGRVALWGLALGGAEGVAHVLDLLRLELQRNMLLTGVASVEQASPEIVV
ncbi:MAG: alpha-hydroxy-acid oxidizing protein [Chloroflexi bacterium]|nr:alpha-hydroxy-acid oxidizing protein [Chloroflexota bacterium]